MNAVTTIEAATRDDILLLLPGIDPDSEEYAARARLRGQRNAMSALIATTESDTARGLAWLVVEYATVHLYAAADLERLCEIGRFCHRLSLTAMQAQDIDL